MLALNKGNVPGVMKAKLAKAVNSQAQVIEEMKAEREADRARMAEQDREIAELKAMVAELVTKK